MLIMTRKVGETVVIGGNVEVTLVAIQLAQNQVRLGISAPRHIGVYRKELLLAIKRENVRAASAPLATELPASLPALHQPDEE